MPSLADIRKRIKEQEEKKNRASAYSDNTVYPHWNIKENETALLRFVNDANPDNPYFWVERNMFKFPFNGMVNVPGVDTATAAKPVVVQTPCMEMYGKQDRVLNEVRPWFKMDDNMVEMGRKYWKKRSYFFQGFVYDSPFAETDVPENPIRRFIISSQIYTLIWESLKDPEIEYLPTDANNGLVFRVKKIMEKGYENYTTSGWSRKEDALSDEHLAAIEKYGLFNLADFLPQEPNEEVQNVIFDMFEASVEGLPYDYDRWGQYYTPFNVPRKETNQANTTTDANTQSSSVSREERPKPESKPHVQVEEKVTETVEDSRPNQKAPTNSNPDPEPKPETDRSTKVNEMLKAIRARQTTVDTEY